LGYLYDEETGIWTKPGWKEIKDGQPHFPHITYKRGRKRITQEEKEKMRKLYAEGYTVDDISIQLKMSDTSVYRYVKE
jgi:DNA invertase Pin-like site-specific DNA recombinase